MNAWPQAAAKLERLGFSEMSEPVSAIRVVLEHWIARIGARYRAVSLPPNCFYLEETHWNPVLDGAILRRCLELFLPLALRIGVRRGVNPALGLAGDPMGVADMFALEHRVRANSQDRFFVAVLYEANSHDLCVVARKLANVTLFGCWWFANNPSIVERNTTLLLEMLGTTCIAQHSDPRVLE